jgi:hypothetical protein
MMDYDVSSKVEQRGILAGMLLGDGARCKNNFCILHSTKQEGYVLFKKQVLEQITGKSVNIRQWITQKGYGQICIEPKLIPLIRILVKKLYKGGRKTITRKFLNLLTPQGIAIWFMDDGSKSFKRKNGHVHALEVTLNTYISKEENEIIIFYFSEVWGFKWGLNKSKNHYRLRMGTNEGKRFFSFISPYVHESMLYKIQTSQNITVAT